MNAVEQDAVNGREENVQEVSLRAVELLAKAQRAADEAVAEAQSYARDLEESAREQYRQILLRAQSAAQEHSSARETGGGVVQAGGEGGSLDSEKLLYVRTYARVAHAQLKSVLDVLNEELDQLAAMAQGHPGAGRPAPVAPSTSEVQPTGPDSRAGGMPMATTAAVHPGGGDRYGSGSGGPTLVSRTDDHWPPIFAATNAISYVYRGPALEKSSPEG
ncbi:hypothetical protein [Oryzihumus leptocrescens]|uniref:Uncharacterized protein n=1 Tax=Oryzihumus leptocrescens TaxID=297536 RepID=A0A542ZM18_9MICO|nr:hypothetical protein [Oryzihumus leptocrescens]TQL61416.1 hypothetical protein FB474_2825 [Oryzihumus leptocrescens]